MLPKTGKYEKLYLYKVFQRNKQSVPCFSFYPILLSMSINFTWDWAVQINIDDSLQLMYNTTHVGRQAEVRSYNASSVLCYLYIGAKMAKYHYFKKYFAIYHCLQNIQQSTTFLKLDFVEIEFFMVLEFMELKYQEKILRFFDVA